MAKNKLYVGKFSKNLKSSVLQDEFAKFGKIENFDMRSTYAFVEFEDKNNAETAIQELNNKEIEDSKIVVEWAREDTRGERRDRRDRDRDNGKGPNQKDVCFNCGKKGHCLRR